MFFVAMARRLSGKFGDGVTVVLIPLLAMTNRVFNDFALSGHFPA